MDVKKETDMFDIANTPEAVRALVMRERSRALSDREWRHRLRGYGYTLQSTERGTVVRSIVHGTDLCALGGVA
jgi:hypothetical protein